ncbi:hypothetical protein EYF80_036730 [Liparis tanakae]|uniref:Shelterin complex subunit TPP1/Est3 domain-containing protein n=1 Tax=Liparis tanakae TaxID=230148 RepID=A0A4Z2GHK2_9TELE|nr:hypothetical protein EYF80_036730 [Liparis tanakae]
MHRPDRSRLPPWIESLILSYGSREESVGIGRLKAHVIAVGRMSQSQALGAEGPTGILFLSDGLLQIPAILTGSAWEHLQEQEDRECFNSLVNTTVCIQDYRLQFHMALEQTRSRFFLSVGQLATTSAGPVKESTPCSTTLPAVRKKICQTWKALLGQETQDSSQYGCDLSELLGEWHHDCLQTVLDDVRERLAAAASPRPSTSTARGPPVTHRHTFVATNWDVDRVRYKGENSFSVPVKRLLIPEEDARQAPPDVGSGGTANGLPRDDRARDSRLLSETTAPSVDDVEWRIPTPPVLESDLDADEASAVPAEDGALKESESALTIDWDIRSLSSLWDLHLPPCETSSCSDVSALLSPSRRGGAPELGSDHSATLAGGTPLPVHGSKDTEPSNLPPYQKLPAASLTSVSPPGAFFARPPDMLLASDECGVDTAGQTLPSTDRRSPILEKNAEEEVEGKSRKVQRKRSEPTAEAEEDGVSGSPPSWLFDSQGASGADEVISSGESCVARKRPPTAHSDGRRFSYSYQLSGQNLQDFSRFRVTESLLQWAVKHLLVAAPVSSDAHDNVP